MRGSWAGAAASRGALGVFAAAVIACAPPGDPAATVLRAFDAYRRGDAPGVQTFLDFEGRQHAERWCDGRLALSCLRSNYWGFGELVSREATAADEWGYWGSDSGLDVTLRTVWSPPREPGRKTLCQHFTLSYPRREWRISMFDQPGPC